MNDVSYELKRTVLNSNSYHVISVSVDIVSDIKWDQYPCAGLSGSPYNNLAMREGLIAALHNGDYLKIAKPGHCTDISYTYDSGKLTISVKYYDNQMASADEPQTISDDLYSVVMKKAGGLVARHFEIFMANELHLAVMKIARIKESGGDGK